LQKHFKNKVRRLNLADYIKEIYDAVMSYDIENVKKITTMALDNGLDPLKIMNEGLSKAIIEIGDKFGREEIFLVELMVAADACKAGIELVKKKILDEKIAVSKPKGIVVIGTVEGDIHNIGKDIVKTLLETSGFEVHDIGVDQKAKNFMDKALEVNAKLIASSALLTTTSPNQKKIEEELKNAGLKGNIKTIIGGAATSAEWAKEIGADFYASTATGGVSIIKKFFKGE
jgi:corrinoid protein of di/trimethylamine methyltransferase